MNGDAKWKLASRRSRRRRTLAWSWRPPATSRFHESTSAGKKGEQLFKSGHEALIVRLRHAAIIATGVEAGRGERSSP